MKNQINNIETLYNFTVLNSDPVHYSGAYELTGRFGSINIIDYFVSDPKFKKCYLGILGHDEETATIDIWFNNSDNFPNCYEEPGRRLSFEVTYGNNLGYTGFGAKYSFEKDAIQLCFLKKFNSAIADRRNPTLVNEVNQLFDVLQPIEILTPVPAIDDLKMFGGITSVNFEHYGTDIRFSTIPNKFNC